MLNNINMAGVLVVLILIVGCKKKEPGWLYCDDCDLSTWEGSYEGEGDYYNGSTEQTTLNLSTSVQIDNISGNVLKTKIVVEDKMSTSFTSSKNDTEYYYDVAGSNKSLAITLSTKGQDTKLSGTVKLFHYQKDTLVVDQSISFEVYK